MPAANISTDEIWPGPAASPILRKPENARVMTDRVQMGRNAFAALRWFDDGTPRPDFVLNQGRWSTAQILITGENFGCGSSREMAVWCLQAIGIRAIIASSFGDIFRNNCFRNGLLPVSLEHDVVGALLEQASGENDLILSVDLANELVVQRNGLRHRFAIPPYNRQAMLDGLDEIGATLQRLAEVRAFEARYLDERPWLERPAAQP